MAVADRLKMSANGQSEEFENWKHDMRAKVYGGCAASVLMGPGAVAICYSVGAGVLETEINEYKAEVTRFEAEFNSWSETFSVLATMAGQAKDVSMNWYEKLTDFRNIIQNQYDLISGTEDVLWMSQEMRSMVTDSLDELVEQCDIIINDTTVNLKRLIKHKKLLKKKKLLKNCLLLHQLLILSNKLEKCATVLIQRIKRK